MNIVTSKPALLFMWDQFGAYHVDRLNAISAAFADRYHVIGVEVASLSLTYLWTPVASGTAFTRVTLFPNRVSDTVPWVLKLYRSLCTIAAARPHAVFLCNQDEPQIIALTLLLRMLRTRTFAMLDAKFDDSPRRVIKEAFKKPVLSLYNGAIVAGSRSVAYYRFLGMPERWAREGYDTVSISRIQMQANVPAAPDGIGHGDRAFVVCARFVAKKNIPTAIRAYARFLAMPTSQHRRRLVLCGSGALEPEYRELAAQLGVEDSIDFTGFLSHEQVAKLLGSALSLILPSIEEQWGLVVNEAVALGIPILCSDNVGARDSLVRVGINGYVFEPENAEGLATLMHLISEDAELWKRLAYGSRNLAPAGDVVHFSRGVSQLLGVPARNSEILAPAASSTAAV